MNRHSARGSGSLSATGSGSFWSLCTAAALMVTACEDPKHSDDRPSPSDSDTLVSNDTDRPADTDKPTFPHEGIAPGIQAAFGEPMPWVSGDLLDAFYRGKAIFTRQYKFKEGAGPDFITVSCVACHERPTVGGSAPLYRNSTIAGKRSGDAYVIADGPEIPLEALNGALVRFYRVGGDGRARGPLPDSGVDMFSSVNPIPLYGSGLFAQVPDSTLEALLDPDDANGDGISGRAFENQLGLGRIGFKSEAVTLQEIITSSFNLLTQLTIETLSEQERESLPFGDAGDPRVTEYDNDQLDDPEIPTSDLWDVIAYVQLLAAPTFDPMTERDLNGRDLFEDIGCATCHIPRLDSPLGPIPAYTDLLVHDMGVEGGDGIALTFGNTLPYELRTQPLWGVAAAAPYLRDGRALTLDDAIRGHGGEGTAAREAYLSLSEDERQDIVSFLRTLGGADYGTQTRLPPGAPDAVVGALGGPVDGLGTASARFAEGRLLFDQMIGVGDGIGSPYFNGDACSSCHFSPVVGGAGPIDVNVVRQGRLDASQRFLPSPGGDMVPKHRLDVNTPFGIDPDAAIVEHRQTPHVFGLGLIESISASTITLRSDPDDANGDGISGRAAMLPGGALGLFGWKASSPSVLSFTCQALATEMGLTTSATACGDYGLRDDPDDVPDPEVSDATVRLLVDYVRGLAPPGRGASTPSSSRGESQFTSLGCAACHVPSLPGRTGPVDAYTDLLLHDVAEAPFQGIEEGVATMSEYRTPPLWGLSGSAPYMHTGVADDLDAAIRMHGGEASASRAAYEGASASTQADLVAFLLTL